MSDKSKIEWTEATWNPVTGCTKVSPGCDNCYAETFAERWRGTAGHPYENGFDLTLRPERLDQPLRWKRPRRIFVNSMSDLFHDDIPDSHIAEVFSVMARTPQHTYQILTKRHGRMRSLLSRPSFRDNLAMWGRPWPLSNVWLGVSVENQQWADIRIPALVDTPAAVRWLSCEPLLGSVSLLAWLNGGFGVVAPDLHWVVVGGESGRKSRPMHPDWARSLRDECTAAGVPFFFKQWGEWLPVRTPSGEHHERVGKRGAGRELDDRTWDEYPTAVA